MTIKAAGVELLTQESSKVWVDDACGDCQPRFQAGPKVMLLSGCVAGVSVLILIQQRDVGQR